MLYEDRLYGFAVAAVGSVRGLDAHSGKTAVEWHAGQVMEIAVAMEAAFSATLKARRDAAEQAARKAREDAARAEAAPAELPACDWTAYGTPCGRPAVVTRVQRGLTRERPMCASHESAGEALDYWLPKGTVQP